MQKKLWIGDLGKITGGLLCPPVLNLGDYVEFFDMHCHSYFSPLDGLNSPTELVLRAKEIGLNGLSITDHGTLAAHDEMLRAGIENDFPIALGVEGYFSGTNNRFDRTSRNKRSDGEDVYHHIILLAKNDVGRRSINKIMSAAWNESYYEKPLIDFELLDQLGEDIIISSACVGGIISQKLRANDEDGARKIMKMFVDRFGEDFYIELQTHNDSIAAGLNGQLLSLADEFKVKPVITTDTHFAKEEDRWIEDALLILNTNPKKITGANMSHAATLDLMDRYNYLYPKRKMSFEHIDAFLQTGLELYSAMKETGINRPDLISNTLEVLDKIG